MLRRPLLPAFAPALLRGLVLGLALLLLPGCDNPACVFGGDCSGGGGGGLGTGEATLPEDHAWLAPGAPTITNTFPKTGLVSTTTPVVVVFSESMAPGPLQSGVRIVQVGGFGVPLPTLPGTLVGDGRMLVLVPLQPLMASTSYEIRFAGGESKIYDLQGTELLQPADGLIATFQVAATNPSAPRVVTTWPPHQATGQSTTGELVVIFDRRVVAPLSNDAFVVRVNGLPPAHNPPPQEVSFSSGGGAVSTTDTRAWRYRSVDPAGLAASFPPSATVQLRLSPPGHPIVAESGGVLPETVVSNTLAPFATPLSVQIVSVPMDAIGLDNLNDVRPLEVALELDGAQASDTLGVFLFGLSKTTEPRLIALFRDVLLSDAGFDPGTGIATLREVHLELAEDEGAVLGDGSLGLAVRLERGGVAGAVRVLDTDPDLEGIQSPILDTTRPTLTGLGTTGTSATSFSSDLAGFTLVGRASETLRVVEVTTALGDNGMLAPVVASGPSGLFIAAPVLSGGQSLGVLPASALPLPFDAEIYDQALNQALVPVSGMFRQLGASGPGNPLPGAAQVQVELFDSRTLAPISGARVIAHSEDQGQSLLLGSSQTDANGRAQVPAAAQGETLITADAGGYDLASFQGVPTDRLSLPLDRAPLVPGQVVGVVSSGGDSFSQLARTVADSRLFAQDELAITVQSCSFNTITSQYQCGFGPRPVMAGRLGSATLLGLDVPASEFLYSAQSFLKAFRLEVPVAPASPGAPQTLQIASGPLLDAAGLDQEERALDGTPTVLDASGILGLDLAALNSGPRTAVQARVPGMPGTATVGAGVAFAEPGTPTSAWRVRHAIPGSVDPTDGKYPGDLKGSLITLGTVEPGLLLRAELRGTTGAVSGRRVPLDQVPATLPLIDAPVLLAPVGAALGPSFLLVFDDVLPDSLGQGGVHSVLLSTSGRRWLLRRLDAPGTGQLSLRVPDLSGAGGAGLDPGAVVALIQVFGWTGFDSQRFAWSDREREHDAFASSDPASFVLQ